MVLNPPRGFEKRNFHDTSQPSGLLATPPGGEEPDDLVLRAWWGLNDTISYRRPGMRAHAGFSETEFCLMKLILLALAGLLLFSSCALIPVQSNLDETRWLLQSLRGQPLLEGTAITAKFSQDGISGTSGCNFYGAKLSFSPVKRMEIVEVANTEMYCEAPSGLMEQEELYLQTLAAATSYRLEDDNLFLLDRAGDILLHYRLLPRFENNPALLVGKTWRLVSAEGMDAYDLGSFTLQFEEESFRGTTICRDYEGRYQSAEDSLHISMLTMLGEVDCSQEELVVEEAYTNLFEMVDQYQVTSDRLELYTKKYDRLIFEWSPAE